jgi:hypothetical protein
MADDKKKLSWREIDKLKDQSGLAKFRKKREKAERAESPLLDETKKKSYLKELEKLFQVKNSKEMEEALKKLHQSASKRDFKKLALEFIEKFGLPTDAMTLLLFLDSKEKELILKTIQFIKENFSLFSKEDLEALVTKLKTLRYTVTDPAVSFKVEKVLKELPL